ncbi:hypothetical protein BP6252_04451 [Coleophoma cylindrospora]|uniref:Uncharacterized protein n=1 Tax=Coleophoma cylindrospora TaxID=1849047 RepID=A0A3D8S0I3_9HELO|nr:hypothetical protein BP6252_04451 [Coleophoma cylindrospora]
MQFTKISAVLALMISFVAAAPIADAAPAPAPAPEAAPADAVAPYSPAYFYSYSTGAEASSKDLGIIGDQIP